MGSPWRGEKKTCSDQQSITFGFSTSVFHGYDSIPDPDGTDRGTYWTGTYWTDRTGRAGLWVMTEGDPGVPSQRAVTQNRRQLPDIGQSLPGPSK